VAINFQGVVNSVIGASDFSQALIAGLSDALQIEQLRITGQAQTEALLANTAALLKNTSARGSSSTGTTAGGVAESVLGGLGGGLLSPLISGLIGLFGGGKGEMPTPLAVYTPPVAVNYEAGFSRTAGSAGPAPYAASAADYGAGTSDGQPVISGPPRGDCASGERSDAEFARFERCGERSVRGGAWRSKG
jgi:hypothetical protein